MANLIEQLRLYREAEAAASQQPTTSYTPPPSQPVTAPLGDLPKDETLYDPKKATVAGQVASLLESDSPVLQAAEARANRAYNARGLLSSGGAVQGATGAVISKALEIATPDASFNQQLAGQRQKAQLDATLNQQVANIERARIDQQGRITGALESQAQKGRTQLQYLSDQAQERRIQLEASLAQNVRALEIDSAKKQQIIAAAGNMGAALTGTLERILRDDNITNKDVAIEAVMTRHRAEMSTLSAIAGLELDWS